MIFTSNRLTSNTKSLENRKLDVIWEFILHFANGIRGLFTLKIYKKNDEISNVSRRLISAYDIDLVIQMTAIEHVLESD